MDLRVGLIGLGVMGRNHARVLSRLDGVDLVGICETAPGIEGPYLGYPVYRSIEDLIRLGLDYAVVAVSTQNHLEIAKRLAKSGVHALIEKPLSFNRESCLEIIDAFDQASVLGAVGHIERFNPAVREAKERLVQVGQIFQITTIRQGPFPGRISDVGVAKDLATHDIDLVNWISGSRYKDVFAQVVTKEGRKYEDCLVAIARLENETIVNHIVNWISPTKERSVIVMGEHGSLKIDTLMGDLTFYESGNLQNNWEEISRFRGISEGSVVRYAVSKYEPLVREHELFRNAIIGHGGDFVSLEEGYFAVKIAEEMLTSANLGSSHTISWD